MKIKTALISVSDKQGLIEFARGLAELSVEIISTGGTAKALQQAGIGVTQVENVTGFPEMLDGRVKTLHPKIHAGILALRSSREHMQTIAKHGIKPIDLVCVNLYPFRETVAKQGTALEDAIENIDIGGPAMIRAAAKNYEGCAVVVKPEQYAAVLEEMRRSKSELSPETRKQLMRSAFEHTAVYDAAVAKYLGEKFKDLPKNAGIEKFPKDLLLAFEKVQECRYGENPHQAAAVYREIGARESIAGAEQLNGKELSFNNFYDLNAAVQCALEFGEPTAVIVKHTNPCGVASAGKISKAFRLALGCDAVSAFGGIIALNRECDAETAKQITAFFNEAVAAPSFSNGAIEELKKKQNLRVMKIPFLGRAPDKSQGRKTGSKPIPQKTGLENSLDFKRILGGVLVQDADAAVLENADLKIVSKRRPSAAELDAMRFAWKVVKHVKSNAIVVAKGKQTLGIGAGQMNRVQSMELALKQAGQKAKGAVAASDAFFPFRDSIDLAAKAGISAIIETGGSVKDGEVIKAADEKGIALVFTGMRHFRH